MNDDAIFLTYRVDCIAGKPPPTRACFFSRICMLEEILAASWRERLPPLLLINNTVHEPQFLALGRVDDHFVALFLLQKGPRHR